MYGLLRNRRTASWFAVGAFLFASGFVQGRTLDRTATQDIDAAVRAEIETGHGVGVAVGIVVDGKLVFTADHGMANLETGTKVTDRTVFRIASVTKQFTATAILLLAEQGKLSLDDRLARFLPDFPRAGEVTIRQLLAHQSGIHNFTEGGLPEGIARAGATVSAFTQHIAAQTPLYDFEPGTAFHYSNSGYFLLGAIIEKVTGLSYRAFMQQAIFDPLGMKQTSIDNNQDIVPGRASGYQGDRNAPGVFRNAAYTDMSIPFAAGAIRSTVRDLSIWIAALHGGKVLKPESLRALTTPVKVADGRLSHEARWDPPGATRTPPPSYRTAADYAFGLEVGTFYGQEVIGHTGGISGFNSVLRYYPAQKLATIVLANASDGAFRVEEKVARRAVANRPADRP